MLPVEGSALQHALNRRRHVQVRATRRRVKSGTMPWAESDALEAV